MSWRTTLLAHVTKADYTSVAHIRRKPGPEHQIGYERNITLIKIPILGKL